VGNRHGRDDDKVVSPVSLFSLVSPVPLIAGSPLPPGRIGEEKAKVKRKCTKKKVRLDRIIPMDNKSFISASAIV
jgi:hypothetical protein